MFKWATFREILLPSSGNVNDYCIMNTEQTRKNIFTFPGAVAGKLFSR